MNSRKAVLLILLFSLAISVFSQEEVTIKKKEFKNTDNTEGFKEAWKSVKQGDKYYQEGVGTFNLARDHYLFANQYNGYNAELNYKIGICYIFSDDKLKAIDYLLKAYELKPEVSHEVKLLIGRAYHMVLEFDNARQFYLEYQSELPKSEEMVEINEQVEKLIIECTHGKTLTQEPKRVIIQNLGEGINSQYDDYNPRFAYNDTAIYFTSRRPESDKKGKRSEFDNKFFEDVYISTAVKGGFANTRTMGKPFNAKGNQAIVGVAPDGSELFVYLGEKGGDIQQVTYLPEKNKWKKPKSIKKIGSDAVETSAALSPEGDKLYFISSDPELSLGGKDILVSYKTPKGKWDDPQNIGGVLNSKYDEEGIFLSEDGNTMYFASKGHNSMGGFDIFKTELSENGTWGLPENLGYPINTPEDEVFYMTDTSGTYGYYATIREGGYGARDIYKIIALGSEKEVITLSRDDLVAGLAYLEKDPFLTMPSPVTVDTTLTITGFVRDTIGGADTTVLAKLSFMDTEMGEIAATTMTGLDGRFTANLPEPKVYGVEINATGYLYFLDILDLNGADPDVRAEKDFYLQRLEVGTKVVLENIYFETGKSVLTIDSYEALDQVVRFLENNESVRLEISGHTDNTGSLRINTNLSEARAKAVVDYIVKRGINESQLEYRGYADSQPVADNSTPEGREKNRRVEFKILSK